MYIKSWILILLLPFLLNATQAAQPGGGTHMLYLHIDKTVYTSNEKIWFAAYLLQAADIHAHSMLSVFLVRHQDRKVYAAEKFRMENGLSAGAMSLPDSIIAGRYQLVAYTGLLDEKDRPVAWFSTPVTITRNGQMAATPPPGPVSKNDRDTTAFVLAQLTVQADRETYNTRDSVTLRIHLKDSSGRPLQGLFSIAVVQDSYISDDFREINSSRPSDSINSILHMPVITGKVTRRGKPLKQPVNIAAIGSEMMGLLTTAADGSFTLEQERLYAEVDRKIALMVAGSVPQAYRITVRDPYDAINSTLAEKIFLPAPASQDIPPQTAFQGKVMDLNAVTIKARKTNYGQHRGDSGVNACGDWVDEFDFLNYPYSKERYKPVIGKKYQRRIDRDGMRIAFRVEDVWYHGCEAEKDAPAMLLVPGIYRAKQFEGLVADSGQPQYLTTVYWQAGLLTGEDGVAQLGFRLGDLPGAFRIVVQGVSKEGLISGKKDEIIVQAR